MYFIDETFLMKEIWMYVFLLVTFSRCLHQKLYKSQKKKSLLCDITVSFSLSFSLLHQPHTLLSLVNVHLSQGNLTGALAVFRRALTLTVHCPQCRASLPLMRCLQFYPFLYNLQHQACPCK